MNENFDGQAEVFLAGYASDEARLAGNAPLDTRIVTIDSPDATRADLYPLLKESKTESRPMLDEDGNVIESVGGPITEEDGTPVLDENGEPAMMESGPVMEEVETNDFVDAIDC